MIGVRCGLPSQPVNFYWLGNGDYFELDLPRGCCIVRNQSFWALITMYAVNAQVGLWIATGELWSIHVEEDPLSSSAQSCEGVEHFNKNKLQRTPPSADGVNNPIGGSNVSKSTKARTKMTLNGNPETESLIIFFKKECVSLPENSNRIQSYQKQNERIVQLEDQ